MARCYPRAVPDKPVETATFAKLHFDLRYFEKVGPEAAAEDQ